MPRHEQRRAMPFSPVQMFDLVADIASYPKFLPWCGAARIIKREMMPDGREILFADLVIAYKAFRGTYTSQVILDRAAMKISVTHTEGPFKHLNNDWAFTGQADGGCIVDFLIDFEFGNLIIRKLINLVFTEAVRRMVAAFEARAYAIYAADKSLPHLPV